MGLRVEGGAPTEGDRGGPHRAVGPLEPPGADSRRRAGAPRPGTGHVGGGEPRSRDRAASPWATTPADLVVAAQHRAGPIEVALREGVADGGTTPCERAGVGPVDWRRGPAPPREAGSAPIAWSADVAAAGGRSGSPPPRSPRGRRGGARGPACTKSSAGSWDRSLVERDHQRHRSIPVAARSSSLLVEVGEQAGARRGPDHRSRVSVEGDDRGLTRLGGLGPTPDLGDDGLVAQVDAVVGPDGDDAALAGRCSGVDAAAISIAGEPTPRSPAPARSTAWRCRWRWARRPRAGRRRRRARPTARGRWRRARRGEPACRGRRP